MKPSRETIWAAVYALFQANLPAPIGPFITVSRRLAHWADVDKMAQPYFCMAQGRDEYVTETGQPTRYRMTCDLYVYCRTDGDPDPGPILNPLIDAVEAAIAPNPVEGKQTLGGLVEWCRIEGTIETDEGTLGAQSVAIIPLAIYL